MRIPHTAHISTRNYALRYHEVRVYERFAPGKFLAADGNMLDRTYEAINWLRDRGWRDRDDDSPNWQWDINMHGGQLGFTSFWFQDVQKAVEFKLVWAGSR